MTLFYYLLYFPVYYYQGLLVCSVHSALVCFAARYLACPLCSIITI